MTVIEVNGRKYKLIEHRTGLSVSKMKVLGLVSMLSGTNLLPNQEVITPEFVKEFELIEQKKSNLSRKKRDYIVKVFHGNFKIYTDEEIEADKERFEMIKKTIKTKTL